MLRSLRWLMVVAVGVVMLGASFVPALGQVQEEKVKTEIVTINQVPAPVKDTILKESAGRDIMRIAVVTKGDQKRYEAEWTGDGKSFEINMDADGKLLEKEIVMPLDEVPAPVKETILKEVGNGKLVEVEEVTAGDKKTYEAEYVVEGKNAEIVVAPDGKLISKEISE